MEHRYKYLYHGSKTLIKDVLLPFPSKVVDYEKKVFATQSKGFALMFMGKKWNDNDIELGYYNKELYAIEKKKNIFKKTFSNKTGYLYKVNAKQFHSDKRLGMKHHEYVADDSVNIISTQVINDVYEELIQSDIKLYAFDKIKFIYFNENKYNSDIININKFSSGNLDKIIANIKSYEKKNIVVNSIVDYRAIWKHVYQLDRNDIIIKIGLIKIKNKYIVIIY